MTPSSLHRFARADGGIAAVEFAFVAPILIALFFGGYTVSQCVALSRKVTITTRAMADLTTQFATMSASDMTTVLNASTQIVAPFTSTGLTLRLTEITTDATGLIPTVTWSVGRNRTAYTSGVYFNLPVSMLKPSTSYILSETSYTYTPLTSIGAASVTMSDNIYMLPRLSSSVSYTGT